MAIISIAKFTLVIFGLAILLFAKRTPEAGKLLAGMHTPVAALVAIFVFAISLFWTVAPQADALGSLAKYGKLIVIALMMLLIRNRREALYALGAFVLAQVFLLASSWMLYMRLPVPWATSNMALTQYAVFSSYLDQGIISAVFASICWHLRSLAPGRLGRYLAIFLAVMALFNVFFVLSGRSGHIVAIALLSIAIMWELPKRYRLVVVFLPFLLAFVLFFSSSKVRERLTQVKTEMQSYSTQVRPTTSSGIRLGLWRRAIQIIARHPLAGAGVGSWNTESKRLQLEQNPALKDIDSTGNPHQEYLLWGVQLGIAGVLVLCALMLSVLRDSRRMEKPCARAVQSALLALAVASLFNSSLYDAQIGDFFSVVIGLLLALGLRKTGPEAVSAPQPERLA
ncbi:MAG: O-antigen ligase family protein [Polaromonas sp.]